MYIKPYPCTCSLAALQKQTQVLKRFFFFFYNSREWKNRKIIWVNTFWLQTKKEKKIIELNSNVIKALESGFWHKGCSLLGTKNMHKYIIKEFTYER